MTEIDRDRKVALVASIPQPWRGVVAELQAALAAAEAREAKLREVLLDATAHMAGSAHIVRSTMKVLADKGDTNNDG